MSGRRDVADGITLHNGDALAVLAALPTGSVDAVITDPPYSSGGMMRSDRSLGVKAKYVASENVRDRTASGALEDFSGDNRDQRAYAYWCALWLGECLRVTRPGGVVLAFTDWRQLPSTTDAVQAGGWVWRGVVPWVKPTARPQSGRFTAQAEFVVWGSAGAMPVDYATPALAGFYQLSPPRDREHITQKPVALMRQLLRIVPPGGHVLDPFCGAGSTGVAAVLEGYQFTGVEQLDHYCGIAERRIREALGHRVPRGLQGAFDFDEAPA